jgi:hypothetical protein
MIAGPRVLHSTDMGKKKKKKTTKENFSRPARLVCRKHVSGEGTARQNGS